MAPGWGDQDDEYEDDTPAPSPPPNDLTGCSLKQLRDRPVDQPVFGLEINTVYPEKQSTLTGVTYSIGTYPGGTDVVSDKIFAQMVTGGSQTLDFDLPFWARKAVGMALFATVNIKSEGGTNKVECKLDTYDTTETIIAIEDMYPISSHPSNMKFKYTVIDDSPLTQLQYAIGSAPNGDDALPWINVDTEYRPNGTGTKTPLQFFAKPVLSKLVYYPDPDATTIPTTTTTNRERPKSTYVLGVSGANGCPSGSQVVPHAECASAANEAVPPTVALSARGFKLVDGNWRHVPYGCSTQSGGDWAPHFNSRTTGSNSGIYQTVCKRTGGRHVRSVQDDPGKQHYPAKIVNGITVEECATQCVEFVDGLGCHSFDFSAALKMCRLHRVSDGHEHSVRLLPMQDFTFYARESTANVHVEKGTVEVNDLALDHGGVYFFSMRARNILGYVMYNSSAPMLIDLTPPHCGPIQNPLIDVVLADMCQASTEQRCYAPTMENNHRFVIDGPGSGAVFNGHDGQFDERYTRVTNFLGAHFSGWGDAESGLYKMLFGVGTEACVTDEYDYTDPHAHHYSTEDWTHQGLAHPIKLKDGPHYVTVQALNTPIFGGSYVTTVCHNTPLIVDSTPPIVDAVNKVDYNDVTGIIQAAYDVGDAHSHIRAVRLALGRSRHDDMFLQWISLCIGKRLAPDDPRRTRYRRSCEQTYPEDPFNPVLKKMRYGLRPEEQNLPEGVYIWVRVAATNNVDLTSVYPGTNVFLIDHSPPIAGRVMDGRFEGHDLYFESTSDGYACVNFDGFSDPESGISQYEWCLGTDATKSDKERCNAIGNLIIDVIDHIACAKVDLIHDQTYYATVWAHNRGHRVLKTMRSSNGFKVDNTPPVVGKVVDGTDLQADIKYTDEGHYIAAVWDGFFDPESKVVDYFVSVGPAESPEAFYPRTSVHCGDGTGFYAHNMPVKCTVTTFARHDFDLQHGHTYRVMLEAMNGAHLSATVNTTGVVVDLTPPRLEYVGVGKNAKDQKLYFKSKTAFSANWKFSDAESGILGYEWRVYEEFTPTTFRQVFPADINAWDLLGPAETGTTTGISFKTGRVYHADVVAKNGALRIAHFRTAGALLDLQPPVLHDVTVGTQNTDESAELIDGKYVELADDSDGIPAHWTATDDSSGIETYEASIKIGKTVVSKVTIAATVERNAKGNADTPKEDTANALVQATLKKGQVYHLCIVAVDAAGWKSTEVCSHEIRVVEADVIGEALDGATLGVDADVQPGSSIVAVNWHSFSSAQCGIVSYEVAVGYAPFGEELRPFSDYGVQVTSSDGGHAQMQLPLQHGDLVFVSVRATTGCGSYLPACSDGLMVDRVSPIIKSVVAGSGIRGKDTVSAYQDDATTLSASWVADDMESSISRYALSLGTAPGMNDIQRTWTAKRTQSSFANMLLTKPPADGMPIYLSVTATNEAGLTSTASYSNGVVADSSRPTKGSLVCPVGVTVSDTWACSWGGFYDAQSSIVHFIVVVAASVLADEAALSTQQLDGADVTSYTYRPLVGMDDVLATMIAQAGSSFVVTVTATNNLGATVSSVARVNVDHTPPIPGTVVVDAEGSLQVPRRARRAAGTELASCQVARNQVSVSWEGFADAESGIQEYLVGVGSAPGGTQVKSLQSVGNVTSALITNFDTSILPGDQIHVVILAVNGAGLRSAAVSKPVLVYKADYAATVYDGVRGTDVQWQSDKTTIGAHWEFDNPCPIVEYSWAIYNAQGTTMQKATKVCQTVRNETSDKEICLSGSQLSETAAANDALFLEDGQFYYVVVKVCTMHVLRRAGLVLGARYVSLGGQAPAHIMSVLDAACYTNNLHLQMRFILHHYMAVPYLPGNRRARAGQNCTQQRSVMLC